jgi:hypothetical protein
MKRMFLAGAALLLSDCTTSGPFPSLAPRPGEDLPIEEPVRTHQDAPGDAALRRRIDALAAQAREGMSAFDAAYDTAAHAAAGSGAEGSDSWIAAQEALSRLEAARSRTADAVAELDQLARARADLPTSAGDQAALEAAIEAAGRIAANQQERINRLRH